MRTPVEVASLLRKAVDSGKTRGRLSESTVAEAAGVTKLNPYWIVLWIEACALQGLLVGPLGRGGFGVMDVEALSGAPIIYLEEQQ